ncbi:MAG TPA: hypothetical protein VH877_22330 [Polyangia bacterium]|nr:hypothetical protein [Polyangia bacterium]
MTIRRRVLHLPDEAFDFAVLEACLREEPLVERAQLREDAAQELLVPFGSLDELVVGDGIGVGLGLVDELVEAHRHEPGPRRIAGHEAGFLLEDRLIRRYARVAGDETPLGFPDDHGRDEAVFADRAGDARHRVVVLARVLGPLAQR